MERRIFGLEHEFGVVCRFSGDRTEPLPDVIRRLTVPLGRGVNHYLANGARLYLDVNDHPEYASPECTSPRELVVHERAGDRIFDDLAKGVESWLEERGAPGSLYLFKNNTTSNGNTYGAHENYLVSRDLPLSEIADHLAPFFATRHLLVGSGKVHRTDEGWSYAFSQRAPHMTAALGNYTTTSRAMISARDEPLADGLKYRRLHVIVGDANMSETTTLLKIASTDLVLRMYEAGMPLGDLRVRNVAQVLQESSADLTGRTSVTLVTGRKLTAVQLQSELLGRARAYAESTGIDQDPTVARALELWERTLRAVSTGDHTLIDREIDWAIKLSLIERYYRERGLSRDNLKAAQLDLAYHDIRQERGLYYLLERHGRIARVTTDGEIDAAKTQAPPTRAALRGDFIARVREADLAYSVGWDWVRMGGGGVYAGSHSRVPVSVNGVEIKGLDPFAIADDRVEQLLLSAIAPATTPTEAASESSPVIRPTSPHPPSPRPPSDGRPADRPPASRSQLAHDSRSRVL